VMFDADDFKQLHSLRWVRGVSSIFIDSYTLIKISLP